MKDNHQHPHLDYYVFQNSAISHLFTDFEHWIHNSLTEQGRQIARAKLKFLDYLISYTKEQIIHYPMLEQIFDERFLSLTKLSNIDFLQHAVQTKEEILPQHDLFNLALPQEIAIDVLESYFEALQNWWKSIIEDHQLTQKELRENFQEELNFNESRCQCQECIHIFRTRLREAIYAKAKNKIDKALEKLHDDVLIKPLNDISYAIHILRKDFDKMLHELRFKLKRSSLNKLEADLKGLFNRNFGVDSELGKVYQEKVKAYLNGILVEENLGIQYLSEDDYFKFFKLIGNNLWRIPSFIKKEFLRYIQSVLALKRKDISSTILREYLGQFWLHTPARKIRRHITYQFDWNIDPLLQASCSNTTGFNGSVSLAILSENPDYYVWKIGCQVEYDYNGKIKSLRGESRVGAYLTPTVNHNYLGQVAHTRPISINIKYNVSNKEFSCSVYNLNNQLLLYAEFIDPLPNTPTQFRVGIHTMLPNFAFQNKWVEHIYMNFY